AAANETFADADRTEAAFHELLSTIGGALDIREVFQRLSRVVSRIIPHDEADLSLLTEDGTHFRLYASTVDATDVDLVFSRAYSALHDPGDACLFHPGDACMFHDGLGSYRGLRSGIRVPVRIDGELMGVLALLSRSEHAYAERHLRIAERVADYVAIAVSHQRL